MSEAPRPPRPLKVIFAVEDEGERSAFSVLMSGASPGCELFFPSAIADVEAVYLKDRADAIVTDLRFHGGALADWLTFWPLPTVLIADPGDDIGRIEKAISDEASLFVYRMPGLLHIRSLPALIRKALNIRESTGRQNAHLQLSEHQYMNLLQAIPDIVYTLDGEGKFTYLNDAVRSLGFEPAFLIGRHFSELVHPGDLPKVSRNEVLRSLRGASTGDGGAPKLFDERRSGKRMTRNLELRLRQGALAEDWHVGSVNAYGELSSSAWTLPEFEGMGQGTVGIIRDVTLRKEHELALEEALAARDVLLKEIHHRVKNNLQVVSSLLNLQETAVVDEDARKIFLECQTQIQTMSMVHEVLYRSSGLEVVEMQAYFEQLVDYLSSVYEGSGRGISCHVDAGQVALELDCAIPVALIVNELVSNSMKHAFPGDRSGRIAVRLRETAASAVSEGERILTVEDDGVGLVADAGSATTTGVARDSAGIGSELVSALTEQLRGKVSRGPGELGVGTAVRITFPAARVKA